MAFYGKQFVLERDENFEDIVKALGLPGERSNNLFQDKPTQKIEKNGENYTFTITTSKGNKVYKFKSGVEFDDTFWGLKVKITINVDGNKITHVMKFETGFTLTMKSEYDDESFTETLIHSGCDGVARRFYKAQ